MDRSFFNIKMTGQHKPESGGQHDRNLQEYNLE